MPLVVLRYRPGNAKIAEQLARALPGIVADSLTIPERTDGQLTAADVEVWCIENTPLDANPKDLQIVIWAHEFPERSEDLEHRKDLILHRVRGSVLGYDPRARNRLTGFVWVLLSPTAYGEI